MYPAPRSRSRRSPAPEEASCAFPSPHLFLEIAAWLSVSEGGPAWCPRCLGGVTWYPPAERHGRVCGPALTCRTRVLCRVSPCALCHRSLGFKPLCCWRALEWFSAWAAGEPVLRWWRAGSPGARTAACGPCAVRGARLASSVPAVPAAGTRVSTRAMCAVPPSCRLRLTY